MSIDQEWWEGFLLSLRRFGDLRPEEEIRQEVLERLKREQMWSKVWRKGGSDERLQGQHVQKRLFDRREG